MNITIRHLFVKTCKLCYNKKEKREEYKLNIDFIYNTDKLELTDMNKIQRRTQ